MEWFRRNRRTSKKYRYTKMGKGQHKTASLRRVSDRCENNFMDLDHRIIPFKGPCKVSKQIIALH